MNWRARRLSATEVLRLSRTWALIFSRRQRRPQNNKPEGLMVTVRFHFGLQRAPSSVTRFYLRIRRPEFDHGCSVHHRRMMRPLWNFRCLLHKHETIRMKVLQGAAEWWRNPCEELQRSSRGLSIRW